MDRCPFKQALRKNFTDRCIDLKANADIYEETFNFLSVTLTSSSLRNLMITYHSRKSQTKTNFQVFVLKYNNGIHDFTLY